MPRPKKHPSLLRAEVLRVPVSVAEKQRIFAVATANGGEFAGWARAILLRAADEHAAGREPLKKRVDHKSRTA